MRERSIPKKLRNQRDTASRIAISVIIPTKNEEKLLGDCLALFTPERKRDFKLELIVSDGGSSDATIGIAMSYADKLAVHEDPTRRQTIAEGRNRGAAIASGDILMFLNADSHPADLDKFLERIRTRFSIDPSLAALAVKVQVEPSERKFSDILFHSFFNQYVKWLNRIGIGMGRGECQILRRTAFKAIKGYDATLAAGEDFELYNRVNEIGKVRYDGTLLVYESPRRYRKFGYMKVYSEWVRNGFSVLFKKKAASVIWEEVR